MLNRDTFVVVRSAYERTEGLCQYCVTKQVLSENIVTIHEQPFSQALRTALKLGVQSGKKWTLCLDADVILFDNAIQVLCDEIAKAPHQALGIQGQVYDRFFPAPKMRGYHLYRTELLSKALDQIQDETVDSRPETYLKRQMAELGHEWITLDQVLAWHDYEQSYRDLYRKYRVRGFKDMGRTDKLQEHITTMAKRDPDFLIALWALRVSLWQPVRPSLTRDEFVDEFDLLQNAFGLEEKPPLAPEQYEVTIQNLKRSKISSSWVTRLKKLLNMFPRQQVRPLANPAG